MLTSKSFLRFGSALVFAGVSVALFACGGSTSSASPGGVASVDGGTAPPDGAEGVCCPVSMGGCAYGGGYSVDGKSCGAELCDGMCNQHIVKGEHGCDTLAYTSCENGGGGQAKGDGGDATVCAYAPVMNDPRCPSSYSYTYSGKSCAPLGLECWYPGAGDGTADGCFATALLQCRGDGGIGTDDAAADAGSGTWAASQ